SVNRASGRIPLEVWSCVEAVWLALKSRTADLGTPRAGRSRPSGLGRRLRPPPVGRPIRQMPARSRQSREAESIAYPKVVSSPAWLLDQGKSGHGWSESILLRPSLTRTCSGLELVHC